MPGESMQAPERINPQGPADYLNVMSKTVFQTGISWRVVESKWAGTRAAFRDFDPAAIASFTPDDVERLTKDERIIRNRRKIEAIIDNAREILALEEKHNGFRTTYAPTPASMLSSPTCGSASAFWGRWAPTISSGSWVKRCRPMRNGQPASTRRVSAPARREPEFARSNSGVFFAAFRQEHVYSSWWIQALARPRSIRRKATVPRLRVMFRGNMGLPELMQRTPL